jgi:hypothetical protein
MEDIHSHERYGTSDGLWVITCYFNPNGYRSKLVNYRVFAENILKSGVNLLTVECAFGNTQFALASFPNVLQVRTEHVMWQKERLLNVALSRLPKEVEKVAWLDCDILFSNADWAVQASKLLDCFPVVQLFDTVIRLPKGKVSYLDEGEIWRSFAYVWHIRPDLVFTGDFHQHGHTGMAWAARRELLQDHGFYDACISGSGDHVMAHAMSGDFEGACVDRIMGEYQSTLAYVTRTLTRHVLEGFAITPLHQFIIDWGRKGIMRFRRKRDNRLFAHFLEWALPFYQDVQGEIGYVSGTVLHLWHGDFLNRNYLKRHDELKRFDFDPVLDLRENVSGAWEWNRDKPKLHQWAIDYFVQRQEDANKY